MAFVTVFDSTAIIGGTDDGNGDQDATIRQRISAELLTAAAGTSVRVTYLNGAICPVIPGGLVEIWMGQSAHPANDGTSNTDFTGDQVQLLNGGSPSGDLGPGTTILFTGTLAQTWDSTKDYLLSFYISPTGSPSVAFADSAVLGPHLCFSFNNGDQASQTAGLGVTQHQLCSILKIEIDTGAAPSPPLMGQCWT